MGLGDKISNAGDDAKGKAKEAVGGATNDDELERQGKGDQAKADLKNAGEKVKDAFKH
ncbi:CsbD family protein [Aeromicrobium sp. SMF47]|uniref:CsbD family protein n=1 Tax=Aeromicrobium yanjiei TaxID=2662028 RepID=A0A5Q2MAJ5_9ACTN|nr:MULTISPECIES: CsbD family protein [Aeromicrobium]MRJ75439.1 CsbD family protein [Aeromicrobium yanjiei]MRK02505.1 CsbD family protein [Aeromicrobium sp. S22]QGG40117.1 CsbD family protein [Aeromicrobium yanjiei]